MRECIIFENLEPSGMVKFPLCTANVLSPKGKVKKHNRYSKQPRACNRSKNTGPIMRNEFSVTSWGINLFSQNIRKCWQTQISAFVVIAFPPYKSTISGDR